MRTFMNGSGTDPDNTPPIENGSVLDANGSVLDANDPVLDANGPVLDANGPVLDVNGPVLDADGPVAYAYIHERLRNGPGQHSAD